MKIEDQVVSFELSKKLKKLGIKQKSIYYWVDINDDDKPEPILFEREGLYSTNNSENCYSAFTVAELGEMLPATLECYDNPYDPCEGIHIETGRERNGNWICNDGDYYAKDKSEANARAKMMVYLLSEDCYYNDSKFLKWENEIRIF